MNTLKKAGYLVGLPVLLIFIWWFSTLGSTNFFVPKPGMLVDKL